MTGHEKRIFASFLIAVSLLTFYGIGAAESEGGGIAEIRLSIEKSGFPPEEKAALIKRASDAEKAGIPSADLSVVIKRGLARGIRSEALGDFIDVAVKAREQNLPVGPVIDRVQQGLSKGVAPEKIVFSTNRLVEKLAQADGVVARLERSGLKADRPTQRREAIHTVARAFEKSIPQEAVAGVGMKVAKRAGSLSRFDAAVSAVTAFVEMGMPLERSVKLVERGVEKGYSEKQMMGMEMEMSRMMREGWMMDDAMKTMDTMMNRGMMGDQHKGMGMGPASGTGTGMGGSPSMPAAPGGGMHGGSPGMGRH